MPSAAPQMLHATTVAIEDRGLILLGASGQGKSSLALQLIALGAVLVADDSTLLIPKGGILHAQAPASIQGQIEARGVGLLSLPFVTDIPIYLAVDMDEHEEDRLPYPHQVALLGHPVPCLRRHDAPHFASALMLYLKTMKRHSDD